MGAGPDQPPSARGFGRASALALSRVQRQAEAPSTRSLHTPRDQAARPVARPRAGHTALLARRIRFVRQHGTCTHHEHGTTTQRHHAVPSVPAPRRRGRRSAARHACECLIAPDRGEGFCAARARAASCMLCVTGTPQADAHQSQAQPRASFSEGPGQCCGRRSGPLPSSVRRHTPRSSPSTRVSPGRPCRSPRTPKSQHSPSLRASCMDVLQHEH